MGPKHSRQSEAGKRNGRLTLRASMAMERNGRDALRLQMLYSQLPRK